MNKDEALEIIERLKQLDVFSSDISWYYAMNIDRNWYFSGQSGPEKLKRDIEFLHYKLKIIEEQHIQDVQFLIDYLDSVYLMLEVSK